MTLREKVLLLISSTPKGNLRAKLLEKNEIRRAVLSSGANVTIYSGEVDDSADNVVQSLSNVYIGLIQRKNKKGQFDGLGALGGLAERTDEQAFASLSKSDRISLFQVKDDVVIEKGVAKLTKDINVIRKNNVLREMQEELADLGIRDKIINTDDLELIPMPKVKDDNYMINIWDGTGECYAITPYCHIYKDTTGLIDSITQNFSEQIGGEVSEYKKIPLFEALKAYGHNTGNHRLEDGRNATKDYRYPHEYLACWALASKLLGHNDKKMLQLASAVQSKSDHLISFSKIAQATSQDMADVAKVLNVKRSTLEKMEKNMSAIHQTNTMNLSSKMKTTFR